MTTEPIPEEPEHVKARRWREEIMKLSRAALAGRLGLSQSAIVDLEAGFHRGTGRQFEPSDYRMYRLACAATFAGLEAWDWGRLEFRFGDVTVTRDQP